MELKQRKKEERERKKKEREDNKKKRKNQKGCKWRCREECDVTHRSDHRSNSSSSDIDEPPAKQQRQIPDDFEVVSDNDSDICAICSSREPPGLKSKNIFWVDCDKCDAWVHNYCAFGKNDVTS